MNQNERKSTFISFKKFSQNMLCVDIESLKITAIRKALCRNTLSLIKRVSLELDINNQRHK